MKAKLFNGITSNEEILEIADRIYLATRLSMQRSIHAIRNDASVNIPNMSVEKIMFDFLTKYNDSKKSFSPKLEKLGSVAGTRIDKKNPNSILSGTLLDFNTKDPVFKQLQASNFFNDLMLSKETLAEIEWDDRNGKIIDFKGSSSEYIDHILDILKYKNIFEDKGDSNGNGNAAALPMAMSNQPQPKELHLKLARLNCIRRYGLELTDWGDDSIYCGGVGVDSALSNIPVSQFFIRNFQKNGQSKNIGPDKTFVKFDLNKPGAWPRGFTATVFLAEKDASGGFISFLQELWEAIGRHVIEIASSLAVAAVGAGVGATVGGAAGSVAPVVGSIIGAIVGAVIGFFVAWLIDTLKDDIFDSNDNPIGCFLESRDTLFSGNSTKSNYYYQEFHCGEAKYRMKYYWKLVY